MKLGARILKTGIAITMALLIATILQLPSPAFAGIAAIFAVQPSIYKSYQTVIEQIQANLIGAIVAVLFGFFFGTNPLIIGLAAIIIISICLKLKLENTISIALVTAIAILETTGDNFISIASIRFFTILLGVLSAFLVNLVFIPPKYEARLYQKISNITEEIIKWIRMNLRQASEYGTLKGDIDRIKDQLIKLDQLFLLYKEERTYRKTKIYPKSRKLVLYRQLITTTSRAFYTLRKLHRLENELHQMPLDFQEILISELDVLLNQHEQALLKFAKKIKADKTIESSIINTFHKEKLVQTFLDYEKACEDPSCFHHLLPLVASIVDYHDHLEHLNTLINSYQHYHQNENDLCIAGDEA
ncbi:aromatic acid exporter family protein [Bacillus sp. FJAT-47783]|uniref:FUSC family protein n=1 Tax=Bacillus sp. FJAT-47783 TaxID=2922712 RepID=UPI001FAD1DB7|nr:aromatic acid exporter family protein [Bacillus sp. FJAT-47783]